MTASKSGSHALPEAVEQRIQQRTSSQSQWRSVDGREDVALQFTFGVEVGMFLAGIIKIGEGSRQIVGKTQMLLPRRYNSENLGSLGIFIHEAVRIWQQNTGRHTKGLGSVIYRYEQLNSLNLDSGQHAAAVKDWFYVNYGMEYRRIGSGANKMSLDRLWEIILSVLDLGDEHRSKFKTKNRGGEKGALQQIVNNHYACVIKEIRNPKLLQRETPTRQRTVSIPDTQTHQGTVPSPDTRIRYLTNARTRRRSV